MNDCTKLFILTSILLNNRLKAYSEYVREAIRRGYSVESLETFQRHYKEPGKHFVLRHDVDHNGIAARKMFECEKKLGVKSTYYFRKSTINKRLIDEMIRDGFDVGFHFETVAEYIEEKHIQDKKEIDLDECRERLKKEIREFEETIGHEIYSICSHGAASNVKLNISSNVITEDGIPVDFTVAFEAYDRDMYQYVDCHIMDSTILNNFGFSYRDTPFSAMKEEKQNIVFLAHPNHWYLNGWQRVRKFIAFILGKATCSTSRQFERIAQ